MNRSWRFVETYRNGTGVGLAADGDLLDVAVSRSGGSERQCRDDGNDSVLGERREMHDDRLAMGMMRCTKNVALSECEKNRRSERRLLR